MDLNDDPRWVRPLHTDTNIELVPFIIEENNYAIFDILEVYYQFTFSEIIKNSLGLRKLASRRIRNYLTYNNRI